MIYTLSRMVSKCYVKSAPIFFYVSMTELDTAEINKVKKVKWQNEKKNINKKICDECIVNKIDLSL